MFGTVVPDEGFRDSLFTGLDSRVPQSSEFVRVALAIKNRVDNRQAGNAGDVADDMVELDVHLVESLLHMLRVNRGDLNKAFPVTPYGADGTDSLFRPMGCAQEADRMEILQPLAIRDVSFSAGNILDMTRVDKTHAKTSVFENLEKRNPEHPC